MLRLLALYWRDALGAGLPIVLIVAQVAIGLLWLRRAWVAVPPAFRMTYDARRIDPAEVIPKILTPIYGFYWTFVASIGLCGALERHGGPTYAGKGPSNFAFAASLLTTIVPLGVLVAPFVWLAFMIKVDRLQAALAS